MANPYHDETGMFCSKGEMQSAIARLATKSGPAAFENYFKLRTEFEAIDSNSVTVSKKFVKTIAGSGIYLFNKGISEKDIREIYSAVDFEDSKSFNTHNMIDLLKNKETPDDIKEDLLSRAPIKLKREIAESGAEERSPLLGADLQKLVAGETDNDLIAYVMRTRKLTFEDKYNISKQSESGLAYLAEYNSKAFFSVPDLEDELRKKAETASSQDGSYTADKSLKLLAKHSSSVESHNLVIERGHATEDDVLYGNVLDVLASNKYITPNTGLKLAKKVINTNIDGYAETQSRLMRNRDGVSGNIFSVADLGVRSSNLKPFDSQASATVSSEYARVTELRAESKERDLTHSELLDIVTKEAHWNSYKDNYAALLHQNKLINKRNAPAFDENGESKRSLGQKVAYANLIIYGAKFINILDSKVLKEETV